MGSVDLKLSKMRGIVETVELISIIKISGFDGDDQKYVFIAPMNCHIISAAIISDTTSDTSTNSNKYAFQLVNKTQSNNLCSTAQVTYQDSAANDLVADTIWDLIVDQNQDLLEGDVIELDIDESGSATSLSSAELVLVIKYRSNQFN